MKQGVLLLLLSIENTCAACGLFQEAVGVLEPNKDQPETKDNRRRINLYAWDK